MDAVADCKDTMMAMIHDLYQQYIVQQKQEYIYLIIEGDAKLYEVLQSLKHEYGRNLQWLIPLPGGWHMLMKYQIALMKAYYATDAGHYNYESS